SREQDVLVRALKHSLRTGFSVVQVPNHPSEATHRASVRRGGATGQPYPMEIGAHMPTLAWPEDNRPTVEGVALGRLLFHDTRLSRDGSVSCASCHREGHALADGGRAASAGVRKQLGTRNAMPLFNLAWAKEFFWDGRSRSLREQALVPIQDPHEMAETLPRVVRKLAADRTMADRFTRAFGGPVTADRIGRALEQFELTLVSQDSKFDRVMKGADRFTPGEKRGFDLFLMEHDPKNGLYGADCFHCHGGALFTNHQFANNGLRLRLGDIGREKVSGDAADRGKFRTPSLRNVALTAPYMHDGRFKSLEEVVEHYDRGVERQSTLDPNLAKHPIEGLGLSHEDKAALVAFLRTLTDPAMAGAPAGTVAATATATSAKP
ncbi:MAG TPA: cytochrome c peroxidase, partial [Burkholderiaceae bacterium]|nr:cytochrome c peroxidase [Burkholderiaceae bacterium]